jgi:hypothetical protein
VNFPDQEYKDIFGGTMGQQEERERQYYKIGADGQSRATQDYLAKQQAKP